MNHENQSGAENSLYPDEAIRTSAETYHTDYDSGDSHSSIELFRESPAKYAAIRVFRTMRPDPPTPAMKVGQALHTLLLEYEREYPFALAGPRKKSSAASLWHDNVDSTLGKTPLSQKEVFLLCSMWSAIAFETDAWNLLVNQLGMNENTFYADDGVTGIRLKCKPDRVLENGLVVDLKTSDGPVDPSTWSRTLVKWGYHRQAAFYLDVLALAGRKADMFVFVAISKDQPHEIGIYVLDEASIEQGRRENGELLARLAECRRTGIWKHEWQGKILTAGVPRWALS